MPVATWVLVVVFCVGVASAGESWPEFRGPTGDGHSDSTGLPLTWSETENVAWKTPIHDRGWSSPVVWGNQVWVTTANCVLSPNSATNTSPKVVIKADQSIPFITARRILLLKVDVVQRTVARVGNPSYEGK